jgi:glycosyltransferase involved in cell wall biosynthesis
MKIALLSHDFPEYCIQQANGLVRHAEVLLMLPGADAEEYAAALDPAVKYQPFTKRRLRQPGRQLLEIGRVLRRVGQFRPDVVHFQHGHLWLNLALPILRRYPLVATIHDPQRHTGDRASEKTPLRVMNFGYRQADRIIVHGEELKRQVAKSLHAPASRIHSVPHIAIGRGANVAPRAESKRQVLFFGRIWAYKGLEYLIRAEPIISRAIPDIRIIIAGEGEDFGRYEQLFVNSDRFSVRNRYIPAVERDELFENCDVVALPYTDATQSGVIPVAYSFGKPVVASRVGALAEAVDDGVTGYLVPPRDIDALASAIIQIVSEPARCRQMGIAGRRKLDAEWSPNVVAAQTLEVYRRAIEDRVNRGRTFSWKRIASSTYSEK